MVSKDTKIEQKKKNMGLNETNMIAKENKLKQEKKNMASNQANMVAKDNKMKQEKKNKASNEANMAAKDTKIEQKRKNKAAVAVRLNKPLTADAHSNLERPSKSTMPKRDNIEPKMMKKIILKGVIRDNIEPEMQKNILKGAVQRRPQVGQSDKLKLDADALEEKFQASKRKLQDHYDKAQAAKRLRTAQYVEFHDLPIQGPSCRIPSSKPKSRKRSGAGGRRFIQE